jgi:hypothetical protein
MTVRTICKIVIIRYHNRAFSALKTPFSYPIIIMERKKSVKDETLGVY